jgi:hypothetical protein
MTAALRCSTLAVAPRYLSFQVRSISFFFRIPRCCLYSCLPCVCLVSALLVSFSVPLLPRLASDNSCAHITSTDLHGRVASPSLAPAPLTPSHPSDHYGGVFQGLAFSPIDTNQLVYCSGHDVLAWDLRSDPPQKRRFVGTLVVVLFYRLI